ncbi:YycH family regulatory protein [Pediococcus siamensis]|uniref:YycH family regulatory protein n=1 Tax=Pediococcus siamensis TaxID=381829 RepID=UPI00399F30AD
MRGMRTSRILIHLGLIFVVLLSVVLSWYIWTNPARYERTKQQQSGRNSTSVIQNEQSKKSVGDIYLPTQVIYRQSSTNTNLLNNTNVSLTDSLRTAIEKWHLLRASRQSVNDQKAYQAIVDQNETVMLKYPDTVTAGIFNDAFKQDLHISGKISRIVFSVTKRNEVYLLNDENYAVYKVRTTNQDLVRIRELLSGKNISKMAVAETLFNHQLITDYQTPVKVPGYSYLVNKQTAAYFVSTLMDSDNASSVASKEQGNKTIYTDSNKRMSVNNKQGTVSYEDASGQQSYHESASKALSQSFTVLKQLEVSLDNMRYYNYNSKNNAVVYRSHVEGFPIFNQTNYGTVQVELTGPRTKQINFSLYSLQIPVPTGKRQTTLPSTQTVLQNLQAIGYKLSEVKGIEIGYQWKTDPASDLVVNLTPTWYINYKNKWQTYQTLLESQP